MTDKNNNAAPGNLLVILADDDLDDQELLKEAFESIDPTIDLICFTSGIKCLNYLQKLSGENLPDLIILDYNIPEINGSEILNELRHNNHYHDVPKLVWSTSDSRLYQRNCMDAGAASYIIKPLSISGIRNVALDMLKYVAPGL